MLYHTLSIYITTLTKQTLSPHTLSLSAIKKPSAFFFLLARILLRKRHVAPPVEMQIRAVIVAATLWVVMADASSKLVKSHVAGSHWMPATATWYGSPEGDGSDGGACGYGSLVDVKPFRARVGAVSPVLFRAGEGCGACYKVRCLDKTICSRRAATVIITDECPGGYCSSGRTHFDLSGSAFGRLAISGEASLLRNRGVIPVVFRRTACKYRGKNIAFHVNEGSTDYWLSLLVEFEDGDGDIGSMHIREVGSREWVEMKHIWGANWCMIGGPLKGPFSVKLTTLSGGRTLSARDVIPRNWTPKATYTSRLNFSPVL